MSSAIRDDPENALERVVVGDRSKPALRIDVYAEQFFRQAFARYKRRRFAKVRIWGEESLENTELDLSSEGDAIVIVDAVDGTDLLERDLGNWCSAAVLFDPSRVAGNKILGAFVALPSDEVYFAVADKEGVFVKHGAAKPISVRGPSAIRNLEMASIYFYGQKVGSFCSVPRSNLYRFFERLEKQSKESKRKDVVGIRIYNLGGNPLMVRLVDHRVPLARGIDAVFDLRGLMTLSLVHI